MDKTKAQMLNCIKKNLKNINVLPMYILHSSHFFQNRETCLQEIKNFFRSDLLIVRSSSKIEDTVQFSNAGKFKSVLNVLNEENALSKAIETVYQSYKIDSDEEILIQPMLRDIIKSGVVFTADINTYAPYYIVNYKDGNDTEAVTSGMTDKLKTFISYKYCFGRYGHEEAYRNL